MTVSLHVNSSCQVVENFFQTMIETTSRFNRNVTKFLEATKIYTSSDGSKPVVLLVGNSHAKDLFLSLVTQEALTSRYEFIISQDIQLACFDDQHEFEFICFGTVVFCLRGIKTATLSSQPPDITRTTDAIAEMPVSLFQVTIKVLRT